MPILRFQNIVYAFIDKTQKSLFISLQFFLLPESFRLCAHWKFSLNKFNSIVQLGDTVKTLLKKLHNRNILLSQFITGLEVIKLFHANYPT